MSFRGGILVFMRCYRPGWSGDFKILTAHITCKTVFLFAQGSAAEVDVSVEDLVKRMVSWKTFVCKPFVL